MQSLNYQGEVSRYVASLAHGTPRIKRDSTSGMPVWTEDDLH